MRPSFVNPFGSSANTNSTRPTAMDFQISSRDALLRVGKIYFEYTESVVDV